MQMKKMVVREYKIEHPDATVLSADDPPSHFGFVCFYVDGHGNVPKEGVSNFLIRFEAMRKELTMNEKGERCMWNGIDLGREGRQKFAQSVLPEGVLLILEEKGVQETRRKENE